MTDRIFASNGAGTTVILTAMGNQHYHEALRSRRGQRSIADHPVSSERMILRAETSRTRRMNEASPAINKCLCVECEACQ